VDAETLARPEVPGRGRELWALASAEGGDAIAARWEAERKDLLSRAAERPRMPVSATRLAARTAPPPATAAGAGGRDFGSLVHRLLEWMPLDDVDAGRAERVRVMAGALAPSFGLDAEAADRAATQVERALGLPVIDRARRAPRVWRELALWFPDGAHLVEGIVDLVFEEDGQLVVVDYKSDAIASDQALAQAAHHAPQLQLYGRGLAQAVGRPVRERLVLFTALGRTVPV
jgi:ATP-dependent exoDNAse (exonuclease V) beta subunit